MPQHKREPIAPARRLLRLPEVLQYAPFTPAYIHQLEKSGKFPKRIHLSPNRVVWEEAEIVAWVDAKKAAREAA
jgi:prophage regulatory protein